MKAIGTCEGRKGKKIFEEINVIYDRKDGLANFIGKAGTVGVSKLSAIYSRTECGGEVMVKIFGGFSTQPA